MLSSHDILEQFEGYENITFGKPITTVDGGSRKRKHDQIEKNKILHYAWKKISIFFCLSYWKSLLVRHNLDVMHIEKNVCDNILCTLLNIDKKSKDNIQARLDLVEMDIRKDLHLEKRKRGQMYIPLACYTLSNKEKETLCHVLHGLKVLDGYSSNISRFVQMKEKKISGLKSHDCHILMQQLLPVAMRKSVHPDVCSVLVQLCGFFQQLCSKLINVSKFEQLESHIALILCQLECIFAPSFFTIMMHLPIHLATEARLASPVQYRWMYPIERFAILKYFYF